MTDFTPEDLTLNERYGKAGRIRTYVTTFVEKGANVKLLTSAATERFCSVRDFLKTAFLPQGYPESVSQDYLEYQIWDTVQAFCSSITGTLATQAMLKAYGVGDKTATAAGATLTWMLKDGAGMLGRILFAWFQGTQLDCDAKRWRLFADGLNDVAMLLELLAPFFKAYFLFIACFAGVFKSIVGVAGGATRAALTQHQARRDNMADVSAKDGSQETLVNLMALVAGFIITPVVANNQQLVWFLFCVFAFLHLFANYKAVSAVVMETVNLPRLHILLVHYLNQGKVLSPTQISFVDPVIRGPGYCFSIFLGASLKDVLRFQSPDALLKFKSTENFIASLELKKGRKGNIFVALNENCDESDVFKSGILAVLLDAALQKKLHKQRVMDNFKFRGVLDALLTLCENQGSDRGGEKLVEAAYELTTKLYPQLLKEMEIAGWVVSRTQFGPDEWRYNWPEQNNFKKEI